MSKAKSLMDLMKRKQHRVAGLMSGTSVDGIDIAIVDFHRDKPKLIAFDKIFYEPSLRSMILKISNPDTSSVDAVCHYNTVVGTIFAESLINFCKKKGPPLETIDLIGSHGQTIYHIPSGKQFGHRLIRSTLQIGEPAVIAQKTGITTVADFRPADMAAGGLGAPLVPFADHILFTHKTLNRAIQNIGGIANVTFLRAGASPDQIIAFDTGPGNMVIDGFVELITEDRKHYDRNGKMSKKGTVNTAFLNRLLANYFLKRQPPKTTGREEFGLSFCKRYYRKALEMHIPPEDMMATMTEFTARTIADAYRRFLPAMPDQVILSGGGCKNPTLVKMLQNHLRDIPVLTTTDCGIDPEAREAVSFAILAWATIQGIANNVPTATGADKPVILGKIIPGA